MNRSEAIKKAYDLGSGIKIDLEKVISEELFNEFCLMGFIKQGVTSVDDSPVGTWSITESLKEEYDFFYKKPGNREKLLAENYRRITSFQN